MTKGEGLIGLLYAIKDMLQGFAMLVITGVAVIAFFWLIVQFIGNKMGWKGMGIGLGGKTEIKPSQIMYAIVILFVIISVYSLIALTAAIFGVNSGPSGGLLVR
jgi:uncharacterized membrane protein